MGGGLFIEVRSNGARYWRMAFRFGGKQRLMGFGSYSEVSLAEAREKKDQARDWLREGKDPVIERKKKKAAHAVLASNTFSAVAREWWEVKRGEWDPIHADRVWRWIERDMLPLIANQPLSSIEPMDVLAMIKKIEKRGALDVAKRQRARCDAIFRYAIQTGRAKLNPATDLVGVIKSEKVIHRLYMTREALGPFLRQLDAFDRIKPVTRLALRLLILTFVRPGELRGAKWDEFDLEANEWRIPASRMKMKTEHLVLLSNQAIQVIEQLNSFTGRSCFLFPSDRSFHKSMSENAMGYAMNRMGYKGIATPHGFRSTASTILNESGFNPDVIEKSLAREERNKIRKAYNRALYLDERRKMMQAWANYLDALREGTNNIMGDGANSFDITSLFQGGTNNFTGSVTTVGPLIDQRIHGAALQRAGRVDQAESDGGSRRPDHDGDRVQQLEPGHGRGRRPADHHGRRPYR